MSNSLALAAVTRVLQSIVQKAANSAVPGTNVVTRRPDRTGGTGSEETLINVFLFQVTPNEAWRNEDLPTRTADGTVRQRPRLAVDLLYLLTFHGDDADLVPHRLLGQVLVELHRAPRLTSDGIRSALDAAGKGGPLADSDLAGQLESITLSLQRLTVEELSKMWSVLFQIPYVLSVFYRASVVILESDDTPVPASVVAKDGLTVTASPGVGR